MNPPLEARRESLARVRTDDIDLIVVGGGVNGAGIALDASARGLRTVLLEKDDLAVGTSSRSSKLIHGGLRYLEQLRFGLVREALAERQLLANLIAPHLVKIERFLVPVIGGRWQVPYFATGLTLYDGLGGHHAGRFHRFSNEAALERAPMLRRDGLHGAFEYSDGVVDDARLVVAVARTAARLGAKILTRCAVVDWQKERGQVVGVLAQDLLTGEKFTIRSRVAVDATGVFDLKLRDSGGLTPSRGAHIVIEKSKIPIEGGLTIRVPGRVVFLIPWRTHWVVGTTDVPHEGSPERPTATIEEVNYLLETLRGVLDIELSSRDIVATFAGIRPLAGEGRDTTRISREEAIEEPEQGRITVRGGKYTTYRIVSERTVNRAASRLGSVPRSPTSRVPVVGAVPTTSMAGLAAELAAIAGFDQSTAGHLVSRYGSEAFDVAMLGNAEGLNRRLIASLPYIEAEVLWAVRKEYALSLDDVLARRTRIAFESPDHGATAIGRVADILGGELGWDRMRRDAEIEASLTALGTEYGVPKGARMTAGV